LARIIKYGISYFILLWVVSPLILASPDTLYIISNIDISGNKITRENIITRELTFKTGDTISSSDVSSNLNRSRDNIMNTSLFNFVTVKYKLNNGNSISVYIVVVERWYIWPVPIFEHAERNLGAFLKNPDWDRINYGMMLNWNNFRGRKETLFFKTRFGYKEQYSIIYNKPNFGKGQKFGISAGINKFRMHEVNISTLENKPVYLKVNDKYLYEEFGPFITLSYRNYLYLSHTLLMNYSEIIYRDSASHIDFIGIPFHQKSKFFSLEYIIEYDFRDSKYYPLTGHYLRINLRQRGLGLVTEDKEKRSSLLLYASYHKKWNEHIFHNQAARIFISPDKRTPGYYRSGIGYTAYLRGYELYTVEGTSFGILSDNLKYCLFHDKAFTFPAIPWQQFNKSHLSIYANLFFDAGYARAEFPDFYGNSFLNKWLYSGGMGLDFVSYYDQVLRLEVSVNRQGKAAFFIHTETPFKRW
jgi:outer membrane protein assembly factor BamA